jgi:predicted transcriptional regulator
MTTYFAPNNTEASKALFTGRTRDVGRLLELLLADTCVALYGERRSGKTLTLQMLEAIVNGSVERSIGYLIDRNFASNIAPWRSRCNDHRAVYVSLFAMRERADLAATLVDKTERLGFLTTPLLLTTTDAAGRGGENATNYSDPLLSILSSLQELLERENRRLIVLLDEMEILETFSDQSVVLEHLCNRSRFHRIVFLHAGSHRWRDRVTSPGSVFTHVEPVYLKGVDIDDLRNYLLAPLSDSDRMFVARLSGAKPLYAQLIGREFIGVSESLSENGWFQRLLVTTPACSDQIERNIFRERRLSDHERDVLAALAHHRSSSEAWIAANLSLTRSSVRASLRMLEEMGTIGKVGNGYRIIGELIEAYGRSYIDDPTESDFRKAPKRKQDKVYSSLRWLAMICVVGGAIGLYLYCHPASEEWTVHGPAGWASVRMPGSVESEEDGIAEVVAMNTSSNVVTKCEVRFQSNDIVFSRQGAALVSFQQLTPSVSKDASIVFHVGGSGIKSIPVAISLTGMGESVSNVFQLTKRVARFRGYGNIVATLLGILGLVIPGSLWAPLMAQLRGLFGPDRDEGTPNAEKGGRTGGGSA